MGIKILKEKYHTYAFSSCYICSQLEFKNIEPLLERVNIHEQRLVLQDISALKELGKSYKCNYIMQQIENKANKDEIIDLMRTFNVNPNVGCFFINQESNIFHYIVIMFTRTGDTYYIELYIAINEIWPDENNTNKLNMIPSDYIDKRNLLFM